MPFAQCRAAFVRVRMPWGQRAGRRYDEYFSPPRSLESPLAAGTNPQLTIDPTESVQTMTAFIVQISLGDTPADSLQFKALFAVGATLFAMTFALNMISTWIVSKYRNEYD
jgi:hypothetical protein